jgi:AbrB family looped-hinge helix DNA binding protein
MTATITIDSSGRLVLPKAMRNALHLRPGSKLRAEIIGDKTRSLPGSLIPLASAAFITSFHVTTMPPRARIKR